MAQFSPDMLPGAPGLRDATGTLDGSTTSVDITGFIKSIRLFATGGDATCTLTGDQASLLSGQTYTIRQDTGLDLNFGYRLQNLTITRQSGTIDYVVLFVRNE
jgi:hypothetical protein